MNRKPGRLRVGTSGFQYDHWRGVFYPTDISRGQWFRHYAGRFDTVEINNTFYHLPGAAVFDAWRGQAPPDFCYALKFSRYGSHLKKLTDPEKTIAAFLERARRLGPLLGPILVQLPPRWNRNPDRLAAFMEAAPRRHRWAFEFRDDSWLCDEIFQLLARHRAALCIHDLVANHPRVATAGWVYLRFHGEAPGGCYSHQRLETEAAWIRGHLDAGRDVFAYFNNDVHGYAVENALYLRGCLVR